MSMSLQIRFYLISIRIFKSGAKVRKNFQVTKNLTSKITFLIVLIRFDGIYEPQPKIKRYHNYFDTIIFIISLRILSPLSLSILFSAERYGASIFDILLPRAYRGRSFASTSSMSKWQSRKTN